MTPGDGAKGRPFGARAIFPDAMENTLLERFFAGSAGYFVEVGANDPLIDSKIWSLEQKGWTVLLVEPQPEHADRLRAIRKFIIGIARYDRRGVCLQLFMCASAKKVGPRTRLLMFVSRQYGSLCFDKSTPMQAFKNILL